MGADRRTAERMRDVVRELFPQLEETRDGRAKRFRIVGGLDGFLQAPSVDELAELQRAIAVLAQGGGEARADLLRALAGKINAGLRASARRRMAPDLEALAGAEALVMQVGPRPMADGVTLALAREALKAMRVCVFRYASARDGAARRREVIPYGILFGRAWYLVGPQVGTAKPVLWRFDRIGDLELGDPCDGPPAGFSLAAYAARSFGTFQEKREAIILRFSPNAAADARRFLFHPSQRMTEEDDGSLTVRFRAGGLVELVRHLIGWGDAVEIVAPARLKALMVETLETALAKHISSSILQSYGGQRVTSPPR
ncbi:MAG: helix-turn-helix transcriptional regulator [Caulobacteraceae bacterium]